MKMTNCDTRAALQEASSTLTRPEAVTEVRSVAPHLKIMGGSMTQACTEMLFDDLYIFKLTYKQLTHGNHGKFQKPQLYSVLKFCEKGEKKKNVYIYILFVLYF